MSKNEFFEGIRDPMLDGIDAVKTGRPLVTREVVLPDPPKSQDRPPKEGDATEEPLVG